MCSNRHAKHIPQRNAYSNFTTKSFKTITFHCIGAGCCCCFGCCFFLYIATAPPCMNTVRLRMRNDQVAMETSDAPLIINLNSDVFIPVHCSRVSRDTWTFSAEKFKSTPLFLCAKWFEMLFLHLVPSTTPLSIRFISSVDIFSSSNASYCAIFSHFSAIFCQEFRWIIFFRCRFLWKLLSHCKTKNLRKILKIFAVWLQSAQNKSRLKAAHTSNVTQNFQNVHTSKGRCRAQASIFRTVRVVTMKFNPHFKHNVPFALTDKLQMSGCVRVCVAHKCHIYLSTNMLSSLLAFERIRWSNLLWLGTV